VQFHLIGLLRTRLRTLFVLALDAADQLLNHIFDSQHADDGAELIHHQRDMRPALPKLLEHLSEWFGLGDHQMAAHEPCDAKGEARAAGPDGAAAFLPDREQVLVVQNADNLFGRSFVHGQSRVALLNHGTEDLIEAGGSSYRDDVIARHHDFAHGNVAEVQSAMDDIFLGFGKKTEAAAGSDD